MVLSKNMITSNRLIEKRKATGIQEWVLLIFVLLVFSLVIYNKKTIENKEAIMNYLTKAQEINMKNNRILTNHLAQSDPSISKIIQALFLQKETEREGKGFEGSCRIHRTEAGFDRSK
ncbi:hypothetical protein [Bacillus salipaludis]|uniref:hypothetical protein n=1 Tax=Bacillus salipaludis TaxID=2547811 RepID=UPI002E1DD96C|nr:hypothetical protein [Bacillus salipaludis]